MTTAPGPYETNGLSIRAIDHGELHTVARVGSRGWLTPEAETDTARLLAAAPDMLAALVALFENCAIGRKHWGDGSNQNEATAAINAGFAAIAKATGGVA